MTEKNFTGSLQAKRLNEVRHIFAERTIGKGEYRNTISFAEGGCIQRPHISVLEAYIKPVFFQKDYSFNIYPEKNYREDFILRIENFFADECNIDLNGMSCLFAMGVAQIFDLFLSVICNPGDIILAPTSYYHQFADFPTKWGGIYTAIKTSVENQYKLTRADLEKFKQENSAAFKKTKILILTSPTTGGAIYTKDELLDLAEFIKEHNFYVFMDEIFKYTNFSEYPFISLASISTIKEKVVTAHSGSKSHSAANFRVGWACGESRLIDKMIYNLEHSIIDLPLSLQNVGKAILDTPKSYIEREVKEYKARVEYIITCVNEINNALNLHHKTSNISYVEIPYVPLAGHYMLIKLNNFKGMLYPDGGKVGSSIELSSYFINFMEKNIYKSVCLSSGYSKGHDDLSYYISFSQPGFELYNDEISKIETQYLIDYMNGTKSDSRYAEWEAFDFSTQHSFEKACIAGREQIKKGFDYLLSAMKALRHK